jgi:hypothetical protein
MWFDLYLSLREATLIETSRLKAAKVAAKYSGKGPQTP